MIYKANENRYADMKYNRCGASGLMLPSLSLGLWHNFGDVDQFSNGRDIIRYAFDNGITHFDLANNYGPPNGSAEYNFGKHLKNDLLPYRDELVIATKAGHDMWEGPYGSWASKKHLIASLDQSLNRLGLDYVDIYYSHRPDPNTPIEETVLALDQLVKQGKALYVGISKYFSGQLEPAIKLFKELKTPFIIHQFRYSMFDRKVEEGLLPALKQGDIGGIAFSPLAQGLLTEKYLKGIPEGSRASKSTGFLKSDHVTPDKIEKVLALKELATERGQTVSQLAIAWLLNVDQVTSVLIGASSVSQLSQNLGALGKVEFTADELAKIETILAG